MNSNNLSQRLSRVAENIVSFATKPIRLADIGSDHAYLPNHLALNHQLEFAIAGEVVKGPYESAKREVAQNNLGHIISVRLGDGLEVVDPQDKINTIAICGMGGILIRDILNRGIERIQGEHLLVLQPNMAEYQLRQWLMDNHYQIIHEEILEEKSHFYEIIIAKNSNDKTYYCEDELLFGPVLSQEKSDVFSAKWQERLNKEKYIYQSMQKSQFNDNQQLKNQLNLIKSIERMIMTQ